jgi:hypothetical protein
MKKYLFVTPEGLTCKPNFDSPEPDFVDMQIIGFNHDSLVQDALKDLIEMHGNQTENKINKHFSLRLENDKKNYFWLKENKNKINTAS